MGATPTLSTVTVTYRTGASTDGPANKGPNGGDMHNTAKGDMEVSDAIHSG